MNTISFLKKSSLAFCFLPLCLTRAGAQTSSGTQIIGYNNANDTDDLTDLENSPYTTFIDGFLQFTPAPTGSTVSPSNPSNPDLEFDTLGTPGGPLNAARVTAFNAVESAGKNVLLSFGGQGGGTYYSNFAVGGTTSSGATYTAAQATQTLANVLSAYVTGASSYVNATTGATVAITTYDRSAGTFKGFNGIDLDFEDTQSFQSGGTYNGATFVSQLTIDLRNQLGANYLITQAPQVPYLDSNFTKNGGSYAATGGYQAILASGAGSATSWLNVQIYNNNGDDGNNSVSGVVAAFEKLVTDNPGISTSKFVLTLPIHPGDASDNVFTSAQITMIVSQINSFLQSHGDGSLAGIAGYQLYEQNATQSQIDGDNLAFADAFLAGVPEPSTWALVVCGAGLIGWTLRRRAIARG